MRSRAIATVGIVLAGAAAGLAAAPSANATVRWGPSAPQTVRWGATASTVGNAQTIHAQTWDCTKPASIARDDYVLRAQLLGWTPDGMTPLYGPWKLVKVTTRAATAQCKGIDPANPAQQGWTDLYVTAGKCSSGTYVPGRLTGSMLPGEDVTVNGDRVTPAADGTINRQLDPGYVVVNHVSPTRWFAPATLTNKNAVNPKSC